MSDDKEEQIGGVSISPAAATATVTTFPPNVKIHTPLPDDHPFYALIGRVTSEWAHLEHALDQLIWDLSGIPHPLAACITGQIMGASPRFYALIALATKKRVDEAVIEEIRELMRSTFDVQEERNRLIHDPWYFETGSQRPGQFKSVPKKGLDYGIQDIDEAAVIKTIERIRQRRDSVLRLWNKIFAAPAP